MRSSIANLPTFAGALALAVTLGAPLLQAQTLAPGGGSAPRLADDFAPSVPTPAAQADADACTAGDAEACYTLGIRFHGGDGVTRDPVQTMAFIGASCSAGYGLACYDIGVRYLLGDTVEHDAEQAIHHIAQACALDEAVACYFAGMLARDGAGMPRAADAAQSFFERACTLGSPDACQALELPAAAPGPEETRLLSVASERALERSNSRLHQLARLCDAGYMANCTELAERYAQGVQVDADLEHATHLRDRACDWGHLEACAALGR